VKCHIKELKEFGEGVHMYFLLLQHIAVLFVVLAFVPGAVLVIFNALGGWYDTADLERTMLGNFGLLTHNGAGSALNLTTSGISSRSVSQEGSVTALFASTWYQPAAKVAGMNKRSLLVAMSALDLVGVVAFFGFAMFMIYRVRRTAHASDASAATLKDYSVRVEGLPPDTSAAALKDYLTKAAGEGVEVAEMELCRCVDNLVALVVERGKLVEQHELTLAKVQRTAEVVTAFVTLSSHEGRQRVLRALPRSLMKQWRMKPERKFNNGGIGMSRIRPVALNVSPAPEPSDIKYENLEYSRGERIVRSIATNTAKYLVLLVGFLLVSLAPALRMGIAAKGSGPPRSQCTAACSYTDGTGNYVLSNANRELYKQCDPVSGTGALHNKLDCQHLYVIYVVMVYSSGIPLLYILAAVHFSTCYWSEKYELLRLCKRPLTYSRDLAFYFSSSLPFAALWHLAFGIWFFGLYGMPKSPLIAKTFRRSLESSVKVFKVLGLMPVASSLSPQLVAWRFTQANTAPLFLAFIACGGVLFVFLTTSTWIELMRSLAKQLGLLSDMAGEGPEGAAMTAVPEFSTAVRSQLLIGPATYEIEQNPAYRHAFAAMEDLQWVSNKPPPLTTTKSGRQRRRTAADKLRAKQRAALAVAAGTAFPGPLHANKVVTELPPHSQLPVAGAAPPQRSSGSQVATKQQAELGMDLQPAAAAAEGWPEQKPP
ncbi:hypothetical protein VOLCADRAFT_117676, partial [Volvox carteri f. nagariensis]